MKTKKNNTPIFLLAITVCLLTTLQTFAQKTNFSGNWKINLQKSEFGEAPQYTVSKSLKVLQQGNTLNMERISLTDAGLDSASVEKLTISVKDSESVASLTAKDGRSRAMSVVFSEDEKRLSEYMIVTNGDGSPYYRAIEDWSLSSDGRMLLVDRKVKMYTGFEYEVKAVYDKE